MNIISGFFRLISGSSVIMDYVAPPCCSFLMVVRASTLNVT